MLHCPFEEILLLDADNAPVLDPTFLFETPEYLRTGTVFWPDLSRTPPRSIRWQVFGVPYRDELEQASGQILVDKRRCWRELNLCNWYNERSDFFYRFIYGDKDTFRFAWRRLGRAYAMPECGVELIPRALCQHDFRGRRLFQHRVHDKWSLAGNGKISGFIHEEECFQFVEQLRTRWRPLRQLARAARPEDWRRMRQLIGVPLEFVRLGRSRRPLVLGGSGMIERGWSNAAFFWWLEGEDLVLAGSDGRLTGCLVCSQDGAWEGAYLRNADARVRLASPNPPPATKSSSGGSALAAR